MNNQSDHQSWSLSDVKIWVLIYYSYSHGSSGDYCFWFFMGLRINFFTTSLKDN